MSFTRFALRLFALTTTVIGCCYLYSIYCAIAQTTVMTLATGKRYVVHPDLLVSSGLGKGTIGTSEKAAHYALINPEHIVAHKAPLSDQDLVVGIATSDGSACAYARSLLLWHQVINDTVGNNHIVVTLCPFTDTATCFATLLHGDTMYFGVSGMVYLGSLVLYDRATNSSWSSVDGRALVGPMSGFTLGQIPLVIMTWQQWRSLYPQTSVVAACDDMTDYTFDPYCKLYMHPDYNLYGTLFCDDRLLAQTPIMGVAIDGKAVAYPVEKIGAVRSMQDVIGEIPVLVTGCGFTYSKGAYPIAVFDRRIRNKTGYFIDNHGHLEDTHTRSLWDYQGYAYHGPLKGTQLKRIPATCTTWFTWSLFYPTTRIY